VVVFTSDGLTAWGSAIAIENWNQVSSQEVATLVATGLSFAGITSGGAVFAFGAQSHGGKLPPLVARQLSASSTDPARGIASTFSGAVAVWTQSGRVWAWGNRYAGGVIGGGAAQWKGYRHVRWDVSQELVDVDKVVASEGAFAALRRDGSLVTWGNCYYGGCVEAEATPKVLWVVAAPMAFAAVTVDWKVFAWGKQDAGGVVPAAINDQLAGSRPLFIASNRGAFALVTDRGAIHCWGEAKTGGNHSIAGQQQVDEKLWVAVVSTDRAFAALRRDGQVFAWGDAAWGGSVPASATNVSALVASQGAFAALTSAGEVVAWGQAIFGGDVTASIGAAALDIQRNVSSVLANAMGFSAIRADGRVVTWGNALTISG